MPKIYSFDTDVFISIGRNYPRNLHSNENLWALLERRLNSGTIVISREVLEELKRGSDGLYNWIKSFPNSIIESSEEIQDLVSQITNDHFPGWIDPDSTEHGADPYVIAVAMTYQEGCVISNEKRNNFITQNPEQWIHQPQALKIPNVCDQLGIEVADFLLYLVATGNS